MTMTEEVKLQDFASLADVVAVLQSMDKRLENIEEYARSIAVMSRQAQLAQDRQLENFQRSLSSQIRSFRS
jgi:hypothetical protein